MTKSSLLLLFLLLMLQSLCRAKKVSGRVRLSGSNSEVVLTKFAVQGRGELTLDLVSSDMYEDEQSLVVHLFLDDQWSEFQKTMLCSEKIRLARSASRVAFDYRNREWKARVETKLQWQATERPHYWYVVIDDCSLERRYHDYKIPLITYDLEIYNGGKNQNELTHLSADETGMKSLHTITLVLALLLTAFMGLRIGMLLMEHGTVHMALLLVMAASGCDALASLCELLHLSIYENNGYGSYTLDAMSTHFEAVCDSIVALLLLSIAAGWTLPSDAVAVSTTGNASWLQSLARGLRSPVGSMVQQRGAGWLALSILVVHIVLAQWGRTYDDDFDSYHALEHLPGRVLMCFRIVLGLLLVMSCVQTASSCPNTGLQYFYGKLAIVGTVWFQSLPLVTWICGWALPYYKRHPAVATGAALVQTSSLVSLAWLVTAHSNASSYHKLSRLGQDKENALTDQLATTSTTNNTGPAPSLWKIGKTKIRLD